MINLEYALEDLNSIKANATIDELNRLNYKTFEAISIKHCLLGQLTGLACSLRAKQLVNKRFGVFHEGDLTEPGCVASAIEQYLIICTKKGEEAVYDYVKGITDTIDLSLYLEDTQS